MDQITARAVIRQLNIACVWTLFTKALWITLYVIMAFYIVCHNGAQYSLERGHKYLNSFQTLYNVGRTV